MTNPSTSVRYCATSIDVVASLGGGIVKAHIRTDTGKTITMFCASTRVPAIRHHIETIQHAFPGLAAMIPAANHAMSPRYWTRTASDGSATDLSPRKFAAG
jgi:hypothetical protein